MPYATPSLQVPASHHHDYTSLADERGPGAFISHGSLPPGHHKALPVVEMNAFHFPSDNDDLQRPLKSRHNNTLRLNTENLPQVVKQKHPHHLPHNAHVRPHNHSPSHLPVPFPRSSSLSSETDSSLPATPTHSQHSRTPSFIVLPNGKPLKSSFKSSSPDIPSIQPLHLRTRSAPSTLKNVHFADKDHGLETFRIFSHSAKPSSLSNTNAGNDTGTETESESLSSKYFANTNTVFPFSSLPPSSPNPPHHAPNTLYDLDLTCTSPIPAPSPPAHANIHLESLSLFPRAPSTSTTQKWAPALVGTIVVRNVAYEKDVAVRFTLDDWQTTSEVSARHVAALPRLPLQLLPKPHGGIIIAKGTSGTHKKENPGGETWDRFAFTIHLTDHTFKLNQRVVWLTARFAAGGGEWWDNNSGENYRVGFRAAAAIPAPVPSPTCTAGAKVGRPITISAPAALPTLTPSPPVQTRTQPRTAQSPTVLATMQQLTKPNLRNYAAPARMRCARSDDVDPDSMYKAFVRQWCFEQGPLPVVRGNEGVVVG